MGCAFWPGDTATVKRPLASICDREWSGERDHNRGSGAHDEIAVFCLARDHGPTDSANGTANYGRLGVFSDHLTDRSANGGSNAHLRCFGLPDAATLEGVRHRRDLTLQGIGRASY